MNVVSKTMQKNLLKELTGIGKEVYEKSIEISGFDFIAIETDFILGIKQGKKLVIHESCYKLEQFAINLMREMKNCSFELGFKILTLCYVTAITYRIISPFSVNNIPIPYNEMRCSAATLH